MCIIVTLIDTANMIGHKDILSNSDNEFECVYVNSLNTALMIGWS